MMIETDLRKGAIRTPSLPGTVRRVIETYEKLSGSQYVNPRPRWKDLRREGKCQGR